MAFSHSGSSNVSSSGKARIDGLLSGYRWSDREIAYSAPDRAGDYGSDYRSDLDGDGRSAQNEGFSRFSDAQFAAFRAALDAGYTGNLGGRAGFSVEGFTGLDVTYAGNGSGEAEIRGANSSDAATGYAYLPSGAALGGDVWLGGSGGTPRAGNHDYLTMLHEVGHALGLKHAHQADLFDAVPERYDSPEYTVMTYRPYQGARSIGSMGGEAWGRPQTYMMLDIAALQLMYGADYTTNSGNTTYSWRPGNGDTRVNGALAIDPGADRIFATIWDGGGKDTYDLSAYDSGVRIDLRPGMHSVFDRDQLADLGGGPNGGDARGNIFNALLHEGDRRSMIENAIGGSGNDRVAGNAASNRLQGADGADTLTGGSNGDTLRGGGGDDRLFGQKGYDILNGGDGDDLMMGGRGKDLLIGGRGDDVFKFNTVAESPNGGADRIKGNNSAPAIQGVGRAGGDVIDLSGIDADTTRRGNQAFELDNSQETGTIWLRNGNGQTWVFANTDQDDAPELKIKIYDGDLRAGDYISDDFIL